MHKTSNVNNYKTKSEVILYLFWYFVELIVVSSGGLFSTIHHVATLLTNLTNCDVGKCVF